MKSLKHFNKIKNMNQSFGNEIQKPLITKQSVPKLTITFQNQQYYLPIHKNSTIKKLALQLLVMLYDQLLEQQLNQGFRQVHSTISQLLVEQVNSVIQNQKNNHFKQFLIKMTEQYENQKIAANKQNNKYFQKNYLNTKCNNKNQYTYKQRNISYKNSRQNQLNKSQRQNIRLYEKAQKSIQRKKKVQKQNIQHKSKVQISYCTFHPNIQKSQKKYKSKQKSNVFNRLYSNAQQIKSKVFTKRKQIQNQQQRINLSYKYTPQINECSKQIIRLKQRQYEYNNVNNNFDNNNLSRQQISFQTSQYQSKKYLKQINSNKVFDKLYDVSFYQNRFNKTLLKVNHQYSHNQLTFHPQLSAGTKRITSNYPKLENRMKIYQLKKSQHIHKSSPNLTHSKQKYHKQKYHKQKYHKQKYDKQKQKSMNKLNNKSTHRLQSSSSSNQLKKDYSETKQKKGIRRMLDRIKTQPLQQISINKSSNSPCIGNLDNDFIDDQSIHEITPKKLNLQPDNNKRAFLKTKQIQNERQYEQASNLQNIKINELQLSNINQIQTKQQIFIRIFNQLSQNNNQITAKIIKSNKLIPFLIKKIIQPLVQQLDNMDTQLDIQQFIWSLDNLYQQLQLQQKTTLLSWGLKLFKPNQQSYQNTNNMKHIKTQGSIFQLID